MSHKVGGSSKFAHNGNLVRGLVSVHLTDFIFILHILGAFVEGVRSFGVA